MEKTFFEKYLDIVARLQVPKLKQNDFAGFVYRSVEDIEEKLKPLLAEHKLGFYFTDRMIEVGGRVYCEATAHLFDGENNELKGTASAREAEKPKAKTDDAQLTGGVSSYARKYAAQGLFLIDDGRNDPDTSTSEEITAKGLATLSAAKTRLFNTFQKAGINDSVQMIDNIQKAIGKDTVETIKDAEEVIAWIEATSGN